MSGVESRESKVVRVGEVSGSRLSAIGLRHFGFTLVEVMVVVALLSLIVIALMGVFNSTQSAFRASVTQTDVMEGGRVVMDLMAEDLKTMSPSLGASNGAVNFYAGVNLNSAPLIQSLVASSYTRANVLENIFILSRENQTWTGTGYAVITNSAQGNLYSLYRFSMTTNMAAADPLVLYNIFTNTIYQAALTNMSHLIDGVVGLRVRAFDNNGYWMTNTLSFAGGQTTTNKNILFLFPSAFGETGFSMYSNTLPASVEIEMATLEDRALQRAESFGSYQAATNYLFGQVGKVHVFRQRVSIPNADPSAYQ
jgi:prepilin-type N-terminal cleavage/methylation domain-containing protein